MTWKKSERVCPTHKHEMTYTQSGTQIVCTSELMCQYHERTKTHPDFKRLGRVDRVEPIGSRKRTMNVDRLREVIEFYAHGRFEVLFDFEHTDLDQFIRQAKDFVAKSKRLAFEAALRKRMAEPDRPSSKAKADPPKPTKTATRAQRMTAIGAPTHKGRKH